MQGTVSDTFLSSWNLSIADIHQQICEAYEAIAMFEGKVHMWVMNLKAGHDSFGWKVLDHPPLLPRPYAE